MFSIAGVETLQFGPCKVHIAHPVSPYSSIYLVEISAIMQHRIASIYHSSRQVIYIMAISYALEIISMSIITGFLPKYSRGTTSSFIRRQYLIARAVTSHHIPGYFTIQVISVPSWYWAGWVPLLCMEALIFGLAFRAAYRYYASGSVEFGNSGRSSLTFILLRDSILFPFMYVVHSSPGLFHR
jgi:hypothetical protein